VVARATKAARSAQASIATRAGAGNRAHATPGRERWQNCTDWSVLPFAASLAPFTPSFTPERDEGALIVYEPSTLRPRPFEGCQLDRGGAGPT